MAHFLDTSGLFHSHPRGVSPLVSDCMEFGSGSKSITWMCSTFWIDLRPGGLMNQTSYNHVSNRRTSFERWRGGGGILFSFLKRQH